MDEKVVEPITMKITMVESRVVESIACQSIDQDSLPLNQASTIAPAAPIAPDSVGVASPIRIVPSTMKINAREGSMPRISFSASLQPCKVRASGGNAGM